MRYLKLVVSYDGTNYSGFQRQKNAVGVQQVLEKALSKIMGEEIKLQASGRTDTGVHAYGQVVSFKTKGSVPTKNIPLAIKKFLPNDIVVRSAEDVEETFHARYGACEKTYKYRIVINEIPDPFIRNYAWELKTFLNLEKMEKASKFLLGKHDFSAFRNAGSAPVSPIRTMTKATWTVQGNEFIFTITGDGFLYHMVRNIVGALVKVGLEKISPEDFHKILLSKDRKRAGMSAPPQGLYLEEVKY